VKNRKKQKYNQRSLQVKILLDSVLTTWKFFTLITDDKSVQHSEIYELDPTWHRTQYFLSKRSDQRAYTVTYETGVGGIYSGIKRPECETKHPPQYNVQMKNSYVKFCLHPPPPPTWCGVYIQENRPVWCSCNVPQLCSGSTWFDFPQGYEVFHDKPQTLRIIIQLWCWTVVWNHH
jgi:hypothetical protein